MAEIALDVNEIAREIKVEITLIDVRRFRWRLDIAAWLIALAGVIAPFVITIHAKVGEPWLYYCPKCERDFTNIKPRKPLSLVVSCPHCNYQSLVGGTPDKPRLLNPTMLASDFVLCEHGCDYEEPYGFVVMAGCSVHD